MTVGELWAHLASHVYLPRLRDQEVLFAAVRDAPVSTVWAEDTFATADVYVDSEHRYIGLAAGSLPNYITAGTLIVRPDTASAQGGDEHQTPEVTTTTSPTEQSTDDTMPNKPQRFEGTVVLDTEHLNRDFGRIVQDVIAPLANLDDTKLTVAVAIVANRREGFPDEVAGIVVENARSLPLRRARLRLITEPAGQRDLEEISSFRVGISHRTRVRSWVKELR